MPYANYSTHAGFIKQEEPSTFIRKPIGPMVVEDVYGNQGQGPTRSQGHMGVRGARQGARGQTQSRGKRTDSGKVSTTPTKPQQYVPPGASGGFTNTTSTPPGSHFGNYKTPIGGSVGSKTPPGGSGGFTNTTTTTPPGGHLGNYTCSGGIYTCSDCGKLFRSLTGLKQHLQHHTGQYKHWCSICRRGFLENKTYRAHMTKHGGPKFGCKFCSQEFASESGLRVHTYTHTGYPLTCRYCGQGFGVKSALEAHENKHKGLGFTCMKCNALYYSQKELLKHSEKCQY